MGDWRPPAMDLPGAAAPLQVPGLNMVMLEGVAYPASALGFFHQQPSQPQLGQQVQQAQLDDYIEQQRQMIIQQQQQQQQEAAPTTRLPPVSCARKEEVQV